jgi:hypothetical protein
MQQKVNQRTRQGPANRPDLSRYKTVCRIGVRITIAGSQGGVWISSGPMRDTAGYICFRSAFLRDLSDKFRILALQQQHGAARHCRIVQLTGTG